MVEAVEQHRRFSVTVRKNKTSISLRIKLTLLDVLIVFFISTNHEFSQVAPLNVCTLVHQDFP